MKFYETVVIGQYTIVAYSSFSPFDLTFKITKSLDFKSVFITFRITAFGIIKNLVDVTSVKQFDLTLDKEWVDLMKSLELIFVKSIENNTLINLKINQ